jgi:hypothetical protein
MEIRIKIIAEIRSSEKNIDVMAIPEKEKGKDLAYGSKC